MREQMRHTTISIRLSLCLSLIGLVTCMTSSTGLSAESRHRTRAGSSSVPDTTPGTAQREDLKITQLPAGSARQSVWLSNFSLGNDSEKRTREELKALINQINAFHFPGKTTTTPPAAPVSAANDLPASTTPPAANTPPEPVITEKKKPTTVVPIDPNDILEHTRQTFLTAAQHPESLPDPFALAELLFRANHLKEAAVCYREAFQRLRQRPDDEARDGDWMLFQIGNCLRKDDPSEALVAYQQLTTEYPDSPWAPMARIKSRWIDWVIKDDPQGLLETLP